MDAHEDELGPMSIVVIEYPADAPMTGEALPSARPRRARSHPRARRPGRDAQGEDGTRHGLRGRRPGRRLLGDLKVFEGASSGLLGDDDVATVGEDSSPGARGDDRVREPLGRLPFVRRVRRNGGVIVATSASRRRS